MKDDELNYIVNEIRATKGKRQRKRLTYRCTKLTAIAVAVVGPWFFGISLKTNGITDDYTIGWAIGITVAWCFIIAEMADE